MRVMTPGRSSLSVSRDVLDAELAVRHLVEAWEAANQWHRDRGTEPTDYEIESLLVQALGARPELRERVLAILEGG